MNSLSPAAGPAASISPATAILAAARLLLPHLERGARIDAAILRASMETAFGASDAAGVWDWKSAYEACEVAMKEKAGVSSRCMPLKQSGTTGKCPICGKECTTDIYWGVAY